MRKKYEAKPRLESLEGRIVPSPFTAETPAQEATRKAFINYFTDGPGDKSLRNESVKRFFRAFEAKLKEAMSPKSVRAAVIRIASSSSPRSSSSSSRPRQPVVNLPKLKKVPFKSLEDYMKLTTPLVDKVFAEMGSKPLRLAVAPPKPFYTKHASPAPKKEVIKIKATVKPPEKVTPPKKVIKVKTPEVHEICKGNVEKEKKVDWTQTALEIGIKLDIILTVGGCKGWMWRKAERKRTVWGFDSPRLHLRPLSHD